MLENIPINCKGEVSIYSISKTGKKELLLRKSNALVANHKAIIAYCIANTPNAFIDTIEVWDGLTLMASGSTVTVSTNINPSGPYEVSFTQVFSNTSFIGSFNNLKLLSLASGQFSAFTLSSPLVKLGTQQIAITWKLSFT